jgi:site-specific DNA recombinase
MKRGLKGKAMKAAKAALYLRVSTEEQTEAQTIQNQRDYLKAYCELNKIEVFKVYADDGVSSTLAFSDRPLGK